MSDSFGDGWDWAEFTIAVPGFWSFSTSLTSGVSGSADFFAGVLGCTNPLACNFDPLATCDNGGCVLQDFVTLTMTDSFGDGWNGASYEIYDASGSLVAVGTQTGGASETNQFCLSAGCYSISVSAGTFPSEIGWTLTSSDGTISGGAPVSGLAFTVGAPFGCTDITACNYDSAACVDDGSCCYNNCLYLYQEDSFGDGWNGAQFTVYDYSGAEVLSATLESSGGSFGFDLLCLPTGCYTYEVTGGLFPSEVTWALVGAQDGVQSGGANVSGSFVAGNPTFGCTDPSASNYNPAANCNNGSCTYSCTGDFDYNGVVNVADLLLLISAFGCTSSCGVFDIAANGVVNTGDLLVFVSVFGVICP